VTVLQIHLHLQPELVMEHFNETNLKTNNMGNYYPQRILKTGKIQKSLCANCINNIKVKFIKIRAFWSDDIMEADRDIKKNKVFTHNQGCKYLNLGKSTAYNAECIVVTGCNQFKNKNMKKVKKDPEGHGNNSFSYITGQPNVERNRDGW
jgi:hypothetical protein